MSEVMNVGVMNVGQSQTITQVLTNEHHFYSVL